MTIDTATNTLMHSIENPTLTLFSTIITHTLDPTILAIIGIIIGSFIFFKFSKKKGTLLIAAILTTGVLIKILKDIFQRARPLDSLIPQSGFAMPSGHTTIAVVFFGLLVYLFANKKHKVTITVTTSLIILISGFTRIYLRVHWLTDVIAGFILGGIILAISILIYRKISS